MEAETGVMAGEVGSGEAEEKEETAVDLAAEEHSGTMS